MAAGQRRDAPFPKGEDAPDTCEPRRLGPQPRQEPGARHAALQGKRELRLKPRQRQSAVGGKCGEPAGGEAVEVGVLLAENVG